MSRILGVKRYFIILWTLLYKDTFAAPSPLKYQRCPFNKTEWEDRAAIITCQGDDVYHCLLAQDKVSVREQCVEKSLVLQGNCPFFTDQGYLHWAPCNDTDCPDSSFVSNEVYRYRICFGNTDHPSHQNFKTSNDNQNILAIVLPVLTLMLVAVAVVAAVAYFRFGVCRKAQGEVFSDEVISDEAVTTGITILHNNNVAYVVGKLGNCVSTVGKEIVSGFAKNNQMSAKYLNYLDITDGFEFSENTVYFIDGWFGLWNDNPCEKNNVLKNHSKIRENKNTAIKCVIGIRSETQTILEKNGVRFPDPKTILLNSALTRKGKSINDHFENIKRKCKKDECPCKSISVGEIMQVGNIGAHLALKLFKFDHNLGPDMFDIEKGPLIAMKGHFKALKFKQKDLFAGILYIVLNGFYDEDNFKESIAEKFNITKSNMAQKSLKEYTIRIKSAKGDSKQQHTLAPMWSSKITADRTQTKSAVVFWHNFLYISAFHACYDESDEKEKMMLYCNLDAILQLVRPVGQGSYFTVEADLDSISTFYENRIKGKEIEEHVKEHPLILYLREKKPIQI